MKLSVFLYGLLGLALACLGTLISETLFYIYGMDDVICGLLGYLIIMLFICTGILRHTILHAGEKKRKESEGKAEVEESETKE